MTKHLLLALASAAALRHDGFGADQPATKHADGMKLVLTVGGRALTATLNDSKTAQDFVSLLPLTLTMNDLFGREKFAHLPRAISEQGKRTHTHEVADIAYWSPGPDVAIFYRQDGERIPNPGLIVIGKLDAGADAFNVPGSVEVKIERRHE